MINKRIFLAAAVLILAACGGSDGDTSSATPAAAQQSAERAPNPGLRQLGGIDARLNGERRDWFVTGSKEGSVWRSQSDVNVFGNTRSISIFGHATADTWSSDKDALRIQATVREASPDLLISNVKISYYKGGFGTGIYSTTNDGEAEFEITNMVLKDGLTHIMGSFSGTLPYRKHSSRDAEPDNFVTVESGRFNVKLPPLVK